MNDDISYILSRKNMDELFEAMKGMLVTFNDAFQQMVNAMKKVLESPEGQRLIFELQLQAYREEEAKRLAAHPVVQSFVDFVGKEYGPFTKLYGYPIVIKELPKSEEGLDFQKQRDLMGYLYPGTKPDIEFGTFEPFIVKSPEKPQD